MMMMGGMGGSSSMGMDMMNMGGGAMPSMSAPGSNMAGAMGQMGGQMGGQMSGQMGSQMGSMGGQFGGQMGQMGSGGYGSMYGMTDPGAMGNMGNYGAQQGAGYGSQGINAGLGNFDFNSLVSGLLNFGIKIFLVLLLVGLVVGTVIFLKQYLVGTNGRTATVVAANNGLSCGKCGHTLQNEWYCCPKCGQVKPVPQQASTAPTTLQPQTV